MEDKKNKIIKTYYITLVISLVLYFTVMLILNNTGRFIIRDNMLLFFVATFLYYIVVKNILSGYARKKLSELDPDIKMKRTKYEEFKDGMVKSDIKWYKNSFLIYILVLISIVVLYAVYN